MTKWDNTGENADELAALESEARRRGMTVTELRMAKVMTVGGRDTVRDIVNDWVGKGSPWGPRPGQPHVDYPDPPGPVWDKPVETVEQREYRERMERKNAEAKGG